MTVIVTTSIGTSEARVIKDLGPEVLVEITRAAIGHVPGERLVVPRQRVQEA